MLSEGELRRINQSLALIVSGQKAYGNDSTQPENIQDLLPKLLETAGSTHLSLSHGAAAIGALCGLLDQCTLSSNRDIASLAFEQTVWTEALDIYLYRAQNNKAKPLRRLLLTLAVILHRHPDEHLKASLINDTVAKCAEAVCEDGDALFIKPALLLLEHFLGQNIISVTAIVNNASSKLESSDGSVPEVCRCGDSGYHVSSVIPNAHAFTDKLLHWISYPDCAPAISRFLPLYFLSLKNTPEDVSRTLEAQDGSASPMWVAPLKRFLLKHPTLLETLENYVFPVLLRLDKDDTQSFLDTLPLRSIQNGAPGSFTEADIQMCLLTARSTLKMRSRQSHASGRSWYHG